ncbi:glucarate dehydratase family protein [Kineosporia rhizophila]|uniref:glucarate dehydratase family protein n=1 Tax=Kineosporia TaxID=49184 RepID=UPI001E5CBF22|nr:MULTISPECIES: glucarate dehydratase family protein [Kineosporia]MCE0534165.1 glucarate dehydratase family protein [Kineosporia rhizophila]GLY13711.1 glucarate dehydratase [Kineosporia sp. NBRC 101677]
MSELISAVRVTPVAFRDLPLLNSVGVHEPFALRTIVEVVTSGGWYGLGETYGDEPHLRRIERAAAALVGADVFDLHEIQRRVVVSLQEDTEVGGHGMAGMVTTSSTSDRVLSPFEVAALDLQGKLVGRPVSDLLGGAVRDRVSFTGYLFYKWAGHPGHDEDEWGAALDPDGLVRQATKMIGDYGFSSIKLKGGVFHPEEEVAAIKALRQAFPDTPLRLDPNAVWTVPTSIKVGHDLEGVLEYLEDPTAGLEGMAQVARDVPMPLATNMCVVAFDQLKPAVRQDAVQVVLSDHHFWGGLRRSQALASICDTFDLGLSMHSNSHLGISLAAMVHLASATPNLDYTCDTHWPWKQAEDDVIVPGELSFEDGSVRVPTKPGLGVELDRDALARMHQQYLDSGIRNRDDTGYMRSIDPGWKQPLW